MGYTTDYTALNCTAKGRQHNDLRFTNTLSDNFRIGIDYKHKNKDYNVTYRKIKWEYNTTDGALTSITPPAVAYDIYYHVERAKAGASYESKLRENIGGFVHDYEDC